MDSGARYLPLVRRLGRGLLDLPRADVVAVGLYGPVLPVEVEAAEASPVTICPSLAALEKGLRRAIGAVASLIDLGCGIRPQTVLACPAQIRVDRFEPYLRRVGGGVLADATALPFRDGSVDLVWASDVIEHLDPDGGRALVREALRVARRGLVIRTPLGFVRQEGDAWGMGGDHWQLHRSGWRPEDFPGADVWLIQPDPSHTDPWYHPGWFAAWLRG